jgi:hypothetical protein
MGSLQVVSPDGTKVFATLKAGAAFGEVFKITKIFISYLLIFKNSFVLRLVY